MNLAELVYPLLDMGLYDQPPIPTTKEKALSSLSDGDTESFTPRKPK